jgi:hypothetical protein
VQMARTSPHIQLLHHHCHRPQMVNLQMLGAPSAPALNLISPNITSSSSKVLSEILTPLSTFGRPRSWNLAICSVGKCDRVICCNRQDKAR